MGGEGGGDSKEPLHVLKFSEALKIFKLSLYL